jgi:ribosomal protein L7Ae-like RNA K-turn-binding protein
MPGGRAAPPGAASSEATEDAKAAPVARPPYEPLLRLLGLGRNGGKLIIGVDGVRTELQAGKVICVVLAADAKPRALEKVARLATGKNIPLLAGPDAATLGDRLGRPPVQAVGVRDRALADGIVRAARPWT